jgi:hypothetical protein
LFYRSLVPAAFLANYTLVDEGRPTQMTVGNPMICANFLPLDKLLDQQLNVLTIMKTLPDMNFALAEVGIPPSLCRGNLQRTFIRHFENEPVNKEGVITSGESGEQHGKRLSKVTVQEEFFIDDITSEQKTLLLNFYREHYPDLVVVNDLGAHLHFRRHMELLPPFQVPRGFPDIVEDISGRKFYIISPETYMPEPAAFLVVLYCLGMLSRYHPDIWMKVIDTNVRAAELTNAFLNAVHRKFPNLILDQMSRIKHWIHL